MELKTLLEGISYKLIQGDLTQEIKKMEYDSRKVTLGDLFVCVTGFQVDGHTFAAAAVAKGAVALVCTYVPKEVPREVVLILVKDTRITLAALSANYYKHPSRAMKVVGITGTNGKTTTTYLMKSVLDHLDHTVGIIGTIENRIGDQSSPQSGQRQSRKNSKNYWGRWLGQGFLM